METEIKCTRVTDTVFLSIAPLNETGGTMHCPRQNPQNITCKGCAPGNMILIKELNEDIKPNTLLLDPEASKIQAWDLPVD